MQNFREENVFSEVLFPLAEDAARALGGDTWYKLMRQYIFNRLGMDNAGFVHVDARDNAKLATPVHSYDGKPVPVPMDSYKSVAFFFFNLKKKKKWNSFCFICGIGPVEGCARERLT